MSENKQINVIEKVQRNVLIMKIIAKNATFILI